MAVGAPGGLLPPGWEGGSGGCPGGRAPVGRGPRRFAGRANGELHSHVLPAKPLLLVQAEKRFYWRGYWQSEEQQNDNLWWVPRVTEGTLLTSVLAREGEVAPTCPAWISPDHQQPQQCGHTPLGEGVARVELAIRCAAQVLGANSIRISSVVVPLPGLQREGAS